MATTSKAVVDPKVAQSDDEGPSLLSLIEADIERRKAKAVKVSVERVDILDKDGKPIEGREGWAFDYSARLGQVDYATVEAEVTQPDLPGGVDLVSRGINLAVRLCRGLVLNGKEVRDATGARVTFDSPELWRMLDAENARDAVAKVYIDESGQFDEAGVAMLGNELLIATGWGGRVRPTKRP